MTSGIRERVAKPRIRDWNWVWTAAQYVICAFVVIYMIVPMLIVIPLSFSSAQFLQFPPPGWSLQWYESFFQSERWLDALATSVKVTIPATIFATILGTIAALGLSRARLPGLGFLYAVVLAPMIIPVIITAAGVFGAFQMWGLTGTIRGLILAHTALALPFVVVTVSASLRTVDRRLEDAAISLGANPWVAFRRVTLPLILPGVLSGALFALITSFDELVLSLFISTAAVRPVAVQMWSDVRGDVDPTIAAVSSLLFVFALAVLTLVSLIRKAAP